MKLILLEQTYEINEFDQLFPLIEEKLEDKDLFFSHLVIDDSEIFSDFDIYVDENRENIQLIEVIVQTQEEFSKGIILSIYEYLQKSLDEVKVVLDEFYQNPTDETWGKFIAFLDGISVIHDGIVTIDRSKYQPENWNEFVKLTAHLQTELTNLEQAMQNQDPILIADITQYEIIPILENIQKESRICIDKEGVQIDAN